MNELESSNTRGLPSVKSPGTAWNLRWPRGSWAFCLALAVVALVLHAAASFTWHQNVKVLGGCQRADDLSTLQIPSAKFATTWCDTASNQGSELTASFPSGTRRIVLDVLDHGNNHGKSMELVSRSGTTKPLAMPAASESVTRETVLVPHSVRHAPFTLVVRDRAPSSSNWAGVAVAGYSSLYVDLDAMAVAILNVLLLHCILFELGVLSLKFHKGEHAPNLAVLALGLVSFAAFWLYFASRIAGITFSVLFLLALAASAAWRMFGRRRNPPDNRSRQLQTTFAPVATLALLLLIVGFYPFPEHWPFWQYAANRWLSLPIDNWLPKIFADQIWNGHVTHPMVGDWLSSDRPPLQAGFYLLLRPLAPTDGGTLYQVAAVYLQATILIPLASIISALGLERVRGLVLLLISTSALVIYNGTFVWPKLIAATFCLVAYAALFPSRHDNSSELFHICVAAVAAALAMLSHGGAIFALLSIFAVYVAFGGWRQWRALIVGAIVAAAAYVPWMLYQHLIDPPGTRLIAWMLAGQIAPTSLPILEALRDAYARLNFDQWWTGRLANLATIFHGTVEFFSDVVRLVLNPSSSRSSILTDSFFYFFFSQWFFSPLLAVAVVAMGWKKMMPQCRELLPLTLTICIGLLVWCVLMYQPGSTVIHQGAYFLDIAATLLCMFCVCTFSRHAFVVLCLADLGIFVTVFAVGQRALTGISPPLPAYLLNADWLPTGSALYAVLVALALIIHYLACRAKRGEQFDARGASDVAAFNPGKQAC